MTEKHFVLVHGAGHGAWCWYRLIVLLESHGHRVTAVDLAASGTNEERLRGLKSIDDYHRPLYTFLEELPADGGEGSKVVLVGHSMGGYAVSSAMERFPAKIGRAVFVSAFMLGPELTIDRLAEKFQPPEFYMDSEVITIEGDDGETQSQMNFGDKFLAAKLYQKSTLEDLKLGLLLKRPTRFFGDDVSNGQLTVTKEKFGSIWRAYIVGGCDEAVLVEVQRWMIENNPPAMATEIEGADHMVMLSEPQELCSILLQIAEGDN